MLSVKIDSAELQLLEAALRGWLLELEKRQEQNPLPQRPDRIRRFRELQYKLERVSSELEDDPLELNIPRT